MTLARLPAERDAEVADRLAALTARLGDPPAALSARRAAWRAHRTRTRLLTLVAAAETAGQRTATLQAEADLVPAAVDRLGCELLLLAGRIDDAAAALVASDPLGWSRSEHPGPVVWSVLLVAAIAPAVPDAQTQLCQQFAAVDTADHWYGLTTSEPDDGDGEAAAPAVAGRRGRGRRPAHRCGRRRQASRPTSGSPSWRSPTPRPWPLPRTKRPPPHMSQPYAAAIPGTWPFATSSTKRQPRLRCCLHPAAPAMTFGVNPGNRAKLERRLAASAMSAEG
jgi:hypothetical protein